MSIPEFGALLERHTFNLERREYMLAQIAAISYNYGGMVIPDTPISVEQLMPTKVMENMIEAPEPDPLEIIRRLDAYTERHPEMR